MTPMQKAEIVELVRSCGEHVVLAIGDGANDVAMIQVYFTNFLMIRLLALQIF